MSASLCHFREFFENHIILTFDTQVNERYFFLYFRAVLLKLRPGTKFSKPDSIRESIAFTYSSSAPGPNQQNIERISLCSCASMFIHFSFIFPSFLLRSFQPVFSTSFPIFFFHILKFIYPHLSFLTFSSNFLFLITVCSLSFLVSCFVSFSLFFMS